jgi:heterodisulfide reductase subunit B
MKAVLNALGIQYAESNRFSCCPENFGVKSLGHEAWLMTAGRNLAVAESLGLDITTACNGCYSSLKSAWTEFRSDPFAVERLNDEIAEFGLQYRGTIEVKHFLEMLYDDITPAGVRRRVKRSMRGLKLAAHPGCHFLRPSTHLRFDDPFIAKKFDELIGATGAESIKYETKFLCCGGSFNYAGDEDLSLAAVRAKLKELTALAADAIITGCPTCYSQFDMGQLLLSRAGEKFSLPVLYYTELLGLALCLSPEALALDRHRIPVDSMISKLKQKEAELEPVKGIIDLEMMRQCVACGACKDDCPAIKISNEAWNPYEIFSKILAGRLDEVLSSEQLWKCLDCYTCMELCGQGIGMNRFFRQLRELALARDIAPESVKAAIDAFKKTGMLAKPSASTRKKLGLSELKNAGDEELRKLLSKLGK